MELSGGRFLKENESGLEDSKYVQYNAEQKDVLEASPEEQIASWIDTVGDIHTKHRDNPEVMDRIKGYYHKNYVIKTEDFPESHFEYQQRQLRNDGWGDVGVTDSERENQIRLIQKNQEKGLDEWLDYLTSPTSDYLPNWTKYWALNGMLKLGSYNKDTGAFEVRSKDTTAPFAEFDSEALAYTIGILQNKYGPEYFDLTDKITENQSQLKKAEALENQKRLLELVDTQGAGQTGKVITVKDEQTGRQFNVKRRDIQKMRDELSTSEFLDKERIKEDINQLTNNRAKILEDRGIPRELSFTNIQDEDFGKLYAYAMNEVTPATKTEKEKVEGQWVKYDQGSDYKKLYDSLKGKGTGWCTAGAEGTAKAHLDGGDFYVYYSNDANGNPTVPRLAIRMYGKYKIGEVRGVQGRIQELDPVISKSGILEEKLKEFGSEGERYYKKVEDMKLMTEIDSKVKAGEVLTKEELRFLYEIDGEIEGFGYGKDPRIGELQSNRNVKEDLSYVFDCSPREISLTREEALSGNIKYHYGYLDLENLSSAEGLTLPESIGGDLYLRGLSSAEGVIFPDSVGGGLDLRGLSSAEGLTLPQSVGGYLYLGGLSSAEGLKLPESIGGNLYLENLRSAEGLTLPESIGGDLYLENLSSAEGLTLPESVGGYLDLGGLSSAEGLTLPESVGGYLNLGGLSSAEGLTLPESVGGYLNLGGLSSAEGLTLPESVLPRSVWGDLNLGGLSSAEGLTLPESIGGDLDLRGLSSAEGLTLPESVGGVLNLGGLSSAEGLTLPESVGSLALTGLRSLEGLILPESLGGEVFLDEGIKDEELSDIKRRYPGLVFNRI